MVDQDIIIRPDQFIPSLNGTVPPELRNTFFGIGASFKIRLNSPKQGVSRNVTAFVPPLDSPASFIISDKPEFGRINNHRQKSIVVKVGGGTPTVPIDDPSCPVIAPKFMVAILPLSVIVKARYFTAAEGTVCKEVFKDFQYTAHLGYEASVDSRRRNVIQDLQFKNFWPLQATLCRFNNTSATVDYDDSFFDNRLGSHLHFEAVTSLTIDTERGVARNVRFGERIPNRPVIDTVDTAIITRQFNRSPALADEEKPIFDTINNPNQPSLFVPIPLTNGQLDIRPYMSGTSTVKSFRTSINENCPVDPQFPSADEETHEIGQAQFFAVNSLRVPFNEDADGAQFINFIRPVWIVNEVLDDPFDTSPPTPPPLSFPRLVNTGLQDNLQYGLAEAII